MMPLSYPDHAICSPSKMNLGIRSDKVEKGSKRTNQNVRKFASNRTWTFIRSTEQSTISIRHLSWASIRLCNKTKLHQRRKHILCQENDLPKIMHFAIFFFLKLDKSRLFKILNRLCNCEGTNLHRLMSIYPLHCTYGRLCSELDNSKMDQNL